MPSCIDIREDLKAYLDGELTPAQGGEVRRHVDGCSECRAEMSVMERLSTELHALDQEAAPSPHLRERILASLPAAPVARRTAPWWHLSLPSLGLVGAAATAAVILVVVYSGSKDGVLPLAPNLPAASTPVEAKKSSESSSRVVREKSGPEGLEHRLAKKDADTSSARRFEGTMAKAGDEPSSGRTTSRTPSRPLAPLPSKVSEIESYKRTDTIAKSEALAGKPGPARTPGPTETGSIAAKAPGIQPTQSGPAGPAAGAVSGQLAEKVGDNRANFGTLTDADKNTLLSLRKRGSDDGVSQVFFMEVEQLEKGTKQVLTAAHAVNGIASPVTRGQEEAPSASLTVTLPQTSVESLKTQLGREGLRYQVVPMENFALAYGANAPVAQKARDAKDLYAENARGAGRQGGGLGGNAGGNFGGGGIGGGGGNAVGGFQPSGRAANADRADPAIGKAAAGNTIRSKLGQGAYQKQAMPELRGGQSNNYAYQQQQTSRNLKKGDDSVKLQQKPLDGVQESQSKSRETKDTLGIKRVNAQQQDLTKQQESTPKGMVRLLIQLRETPKPAATKK